MSGRPWLRSRKCGRGWQGRLLAIAALAVTGAAGFVFRCERGRVADLGEGTGRWARALHLGDHGDAVAVERRVGVDGFGHRAAALLEFVEGDVRLPYRDVLADSRDDVVENGHLTPLICRDLKG